MATAKETKIKEATPSAAYLVKELDKLLTERIADLYEIQGMVQARHAYIYYRSLLWKIGDELDKVTRGNWRRIEL